MNIFQHSRFKIFSEMQHPLKHDASGLAYTNARIPGVSSLYDMLDYIVAYMYPNYIGTFATPGALPGSASPNDYAVVTDDGDGKMAGYVWLELEGVAGWNKRYDVDWSSEGILAEVVNKASYMYPLKFGQDDVDAAGTALTGVDAGQHLYGGVSAGTHLTFHANSADADTSGFVQFADNVRPYGDSAFTLGSNAERWLNVYTDEVTVGTMSIAGGSITDSSGEIDFGDETIRTSGMVSGDVLEALTSGSFSTLVLASASITDTTGFIDFDDENLSTSGTVIADILYGVTGVAVGPLAGNQLLLAAGSITDESGAISFGDENLSTTGTLAAGNATFARTDTDNLRLDGNTLSITNSNGNLNLLANGTGVVDVQSAMTTIGQTVTGVLAVTGQLNADNLRLDANTLSSTDTNGNIVLSPNGTGVISVAKGVVPSADNTLDLGVAGTRFNDLFLGGTISDGTNAIAIADLLALRSTPYRDAARTQPAQAGDTLFWDGSKWLASVPDTEIAHGSISGLTSGDAGHTQFVMLAGRAGGQVVQGGTAASELLVLESTSHVTKGTVQTKDNFVAFTAPSYSGGWSGIDLGSSSKQFRNLYTKGELIGARLENYASVGALPANSGQNIGRVVYVTGDTTAYVDTGSEWTPLGSGGGGVGSLQWIEPVAELVPLRDVENLRQVYCYSAGETQKLYATIKVPTSYRAGKPIKLKLSFYSADTSGTALIQTRTTLNRPGTDVVSDTTNRRTSTNAAVTLSGSTANKLQSVEFDLTSSIGEVNAVAVAAGHELLVELYRGTDTATGDVKVPVYLAEVTYA